MNVTDVDSRKLEVGEDSLILIFSRQKELMHKYHEIEGQNGLLQTKDLPVNLHDRHGQQRIKDFAWRITEELAEAGSAADEGLGWKDVHSQEEIADSFHFLVELALHANFDYNDLLMEVSKTCQQSIDDDEDKLDWLFKVCRSIHFRDIERGPAFCFTRFIIQLGMVCHTLKNKPWKVTHMLTDENIFRERLSNSFLWFFALCNSITMGSGQLFDLYFRKSEVNKFRQRSQY